MVADIWATLDSAGQAANIDPRLLYAVGQRESSLGKNTGLSLPNDPDSPRGFFQMRPSTAQAMLGRQPKNFQDEALAAAKYLSEGLDATGTVQGATAYYHGGPDRSGWGPKTADYSQGVTQNYTQLASSKRMVGAPAKAAAPTSDSDLDSGAAIIAGGQKPMVKPTASAAAEDPDLATGQAIISAAPPAPASKATDAPANAKPADGSDFYPNPDDAITDYVKAHPPSDPNAPVGQKLMDATKQVLRGTTNGVRSLIGQVTPSDTKSVSDYDFNAGVGQAIGDYVNQQPPLNPNESAGQRLLSSAKEVVRGVANGVRATAAQIPDTGAGSGPDIAGALAPAPNTTYGSVLPLARDNTTGALRFALPSSLRDMAQGVYDLTQGVDTGTVTPQGTMALMGMVGGPGLRSPATGTGEAVANRLLPQGSPALGRNETPDLIGSQLRASPGNVTGNRLIPSAAADGAGAAGPSAGMGGPSPGQSAGPSDTTGLVAAFKGAGTGIGDNLRDALWQKLQAGDTTELGRPSAVLTAAKAAQDAGNIGSRSDFDSFVQQYYAAKKAPAAPSGVAPNSVGAAASSSTEAQLTPAQVQAYRSTAEGQKFLEQQPIGVRDTNAYVPGVQPNAAEIEQSVNLARELKAAGAASGEVSTEAKTIAQQNNDKRMDFFSRIAGSDVDIANAKAARSAQAESDLAATWANKTVADTAPVMDTAQQILRSPDSARPVVRNAVKSVMDEMVDADGNPITDPEMLYGVRKHIDDMMSKEAAASDPKSVRAQASLQAIKDQLDGVIEGAAPGFRQYLDNFSQASKPIDAMDGLQKFENKLVDSQNRMQYSRVQNMMRQIVDSRASPGINPYKSIPDETMQQLWGLRDDLRRTATAADLAKAPGSDTVPLALDLLRMGGSGVVNMGAAAVGGVGGSVLLNAIKGAGGAVMSRRAAAKQTARGMELLRPTTELQNRLLDGP